MTTTVDPTRLVGGRYVLEKLIGEGGTGEVWRARHVTLRSPVAIKLLHGSAAFRESTRKRFLTEARVAAQLNTRHAVKVFDFGVTEQGRPYLIMELLDGETLAERLERENMLTPYTTARILRLASRALDAAHALGVVHRDFKPENIFLVRSEEEEEEEDVKVVDFGVAKLVGELEERDTEDTAPMSTRRLEKAFISFTRSGKSVGTPCYMAPEQAKAESDVGHAADIWAIGVVAYECLTGFRPFVAHNIKTLFDRISSCTHVPARERNPALPALFDEWFRTACAPDPKNRFENASSATLALIEVLGIQSSMITFGDSEVVPSLVPSVRSPSSGPPSSGPKNRFSSLTPGASSSAQQRPSVPARRYARLALGVGLVAGLGLGATTWWHLRAAPLPSSSAVVASSILVTPPPNLSEVVATTTPSVEPPAVSASASAMASTSLPPVRTPTRDPGRPERTAPPMDGYRDLPSAWPSQTSTAQPTAPATTTAPATPPKPPPADATATASPFELPDLGL